MPRLRHMRYRDFARIRYQDKITRFLAAQVTRLTSSATGQTVDTVDVAAAAGVSTLTFGANAGNGKIVTIGAQAYTFKTSLTEAKAAVVLTSNNTNNADGDTVTIGSTVYTFQTSLTAGSAGAVHVLIGADADASLLNLARAINNSGGTPGTDYSTTGTAAHPTVTSSATVTAHTITITAKTPGVAGNSIASTETSTRLSFAAVTLLLGVDPILNEVKIGATASDSLDNLIAAINAAGGAGTTYATGTVEHLTTDAAAGAGDTMTATGHTAGGANGLVEVSTDVVSASWSVPNLQGGADATFGPSFTATSHGMTSGEGPYVMTSSGALPTGYAAGLKVWVYVVDANTIKLARSKDQALRADYIAITSAGTGTLTLKKALTNSGMFDMVRINGSTQVANVADIDSLR